MRRFPDGESDRSLRKKETDAAKEQECHDIRERRRFGNAEQKAERRGASGRVNTHSRHISAGGYYVTDFKKCKQAV